MCAVPEIYEFCNTELKFCQIGAKLKVMDIENLQSPIAKNGDFKTHSISKTSTFRTCTGQSTVQYSPRWLCHHELALRYRRNND